MTEEVTAALQTFVSTEFASGAPIGVDDFLLGGLVDSIGVFTIVGFIENRFNVTLGDTELTTENFASVRSLAGLVAKHAETRAVASAT